MVLSTSWRTHVSRRHCLMARCIVLYNDLGRLRWFANVPKIVKHMCFTIHFRVFVWLMVGSFFLYQPKCIVLKKAPNKCSTETNIPTTGIFKLLMVRARTIRHSSIFKQFVKRKVQQNHTHTLSASVTREPCTQKVYFTLCFAMNCCRSKQNLNVGILIEIAFRIAIHMLLCTS